MIDRVAKAQKAADDARLKALQEYAAALGRIGTGGGSVGGVTSTTPGAPNIPSGAPATIADVKAKEAADAIEYFGQKITDVFQTVEDSGAFNALVNSYAGGAINSFNAGTFRANEGASYGTLSRGGAFDRDIVVNVSAGVISQPDEFATLLQETIQKLNRGGDPLTVAGIL
jgi:hypothetical protein